MTLSEAADAPCPPRDRGDGDPNAAVDASSCANLFAISWLVAAFGVYGHVPPNHSTPLHFRASRASKASNPVLPMPYLSVHRGPMTR